MRSIDRDKQKCYIGHFIGLTRQVDSKGRLTGKNIPKYEAPQEFFATVTPIKGEILGAYFGQNLDYDITLTVDNPNFRIDVADILWIYVPLESSEDSGDVADGGNFDSWKSGDTYDGGDFDGAAFEDSLDGGDFGADVIKSHDYVVKRVARKGDFTVIAAKRVEVRL